MWEGMNAIKAFFWRKYSEDFDMSQTSYKEIQQSIQNNGLAHQIKVPS